jgi:hypothetical protein
VKKEKLFKKQEKIKLRFVSKSAVNFFIFSLFKRRRFLVFIEKKIFGQWLITRVDESAIFTIHRWTFDSQIVSRYVIVWRHRLLETHFNIFLLCLLSSNSPTFKLFNGVGNSTRTKTNSFISPKEKADIRKFKKQQFVSNLCSQKSSFQLKLSIMK